jgi:hypothetical protein
MEVKNEYKTIDLDHLHIELWAAHHRLVKTKGDLLSKAGTLKAYRRALIRHERLKLKLLESYDRLSINN